jgi:hypothetical protein
MAREKMADVLAQRDALRQRESLLEEALRATRLREQAIVETVEFDDSYCGRVRLDATLYRAQRCHGGIVVVETHCDTRNGRQMDVAVHYLETWANYFRPDGLTHGAHWHAEQTLAERLTRAAQRLQSAA